MRLWHDLRLMSASQKRAVIIAITKAKIGIGQKYDWDELIRSHTTGEEGSFGVLTKEECIRLEQTVTQAVDAEEEAAPGGPIAETLWDAYVDHYLSTGTADAIPSYGPFREARTMGLAPLAVGSLWADTKRQRDQLQQNDSTWKAKMVAYKKAKEEYEKKYAERMKNEGKGVKYTKEERLKFGSERPAKPRRERRRARNGLAVDQFYIDAAMRVAGGSKSGGGGGKALEEQEEEEEGGPELSLEQTLLTAVPAKQSGRGTGAAFAGLIPNVHVACCQLLSDQCNIAIEISEGFGAMRGPFLRRNRNRVRRCNALVDVGAQYLGIGAEKQSSSRQTHKDRRARQELDNVLKISDAWGLGFCKGSEGLRAKVSLVDGRLVYVRGSEDWHHRYKKHYRMHAAMRPALAKEMRINLGIDDEGKEATGMLADAVQEYKARRHGNFSAGPGKYGPGKYFHSNECLPEAKMPTVEFKPANETVRKWWEEREKAAEERWVSFRSITSFLKER